MSDRYFVDTNILMYAHDKTTGRKHTRAKALIDELWLHRSGVISTQVLQELAVNRVSTSERAQDSLSSDTPPSVLCEDLVDERLVPYLAFAGLLSERVEHVGVHPNGDQLTRPITERWPTHSPHRSQLCRR
jgi:hypothetical protein